MGINFDTIQDLGLAQKAPVKNQQELGQAQFLKLMITQLTNQNPLKPMEGADFLSQMAQFGTVSGIQDLQNSFSDFASSVHSDQALQAANLVGRSVLVPSKEGQLAAGEMIEGELTLPSPASSVTVKIFDAQGALARTLQLGAQAEGQVPFSWDGMLENGAYADPGTYRIQAEAIIDDQNAALETQVRAKVDSVTLSQGGRGLEVNLTGLGTVSFKDIRQIL